MFLPIITATLVISFISLIGALALFFNEKLLDKLLLLLMSFSAGALIGNAFLHLIPEAIEGGFFENNLLTLFLYVISGFLAFFILENFINWHHHHSREHPQEAPFSYLVLISDAIHNFLDGLAIAASFFISFPAGIATALAVALHEIPQEIGDFGVLVYGGIKKTKALFLNFISASTVILGGVVGFFLAERQIISIELLLPFIAGGFIYIASSDLVPEIKSHTGTKKSILSLLAFIFGVAIMWGLKSLSL